MLSWETKLTSLYLSHNTWLSASSWWQSHSLRWQVKLHYTVLCVCWCVCPTCVSALSPC